MTDKFAALVHYIVHSCDPKQLGAIRLNKALWYIDVLAYQTTGDPVTGETYRRRQFGPVPGSIMPVLDTLRLSPLAFPANPYHRLVKHYQDGGLLRGQVNNPELDARLALDLLDEQRDAFSRADPTCSLPGTG